MKLLTNWKKTILPATLALALLIPAAAYAAEQNGQSDSSGSTSGTNSTAPAKPGGKDPKSFGKGRGGFGHEGFAIQKGGKHLIGGDSVNQHKYMELLAEKYAPDTLDSWKAALTEQGTLNQELQTLLQDQGVHDALQAQRDELKEQMKAKQDELKQKLESGELTKEQLREQMKDGAMSLGKDIKKIVPGTALEGDPAAAQASRANRQELTDAIKADNADGIRAALAKLLEDVKQSNTQLAAKVAELKTKATGQQVQPQAPKMKERGKAGSQNDSGSQSEAQTQSWKAPKSGGASVSLL
ncbi:hypothetical protein [Paenibacillus sp. GCM10012303]|uniref:hypothetical protein n=1 Tax=Paenibacillus sp. GCM10012303 TaxID=3317340 RepID=UPI00360AAE87